MAKHNGPKISVNKLAEFIGAKAQRQRQILRDQKYPNFKGMYYREATEAVSKYIAGGMDDASVLTRQMRMLEQMESDKAGTLRRINSNIDAIESFEAMLDEIDLKGGEPELGEHRPEKIQFHNVDVSVRPEIVLRGQGKSGKKMAGAMKIHFSKTFSLNEETAGYVSAVLQEYANAKLLNDADAVFSPYCFVVDVGSKTLYPAVKSTVARLRDIEAVCRNITAIWDSISPDE